MTMGRTAVVSYRSVIAVYFVFIGLLYPISGMLIFSFLYCYQMCNRFIISVLVECLDWTLHE